MEAFFVFFARFAEVHLWIDYPGQQQFTGGVYGFFRGCDDGIIDAHNLAIRTREVSGKGTAVGSGDGGVAYQQAKQNDSRISSSKMRQ